MRLETSESSAKPRVPLSQRASKSDGADGPEGGLDRRSAGKATALITSKAMVPKTLPIRPPISAPGTKSTPQTSQSVSSLAVAKPSTTWSS